MCNHFAANLQQGCPTTFMIALRSCTPSRSERAFAAPSSGRRHRRGSPGRRSPRFHHVAHGIGGRSRRQHRQPGRCDWRRRIRLHRSPGIHAPGPARQTGQQYHQAGASCAQGSHRTLLALLNPSNHGLPSVVQAEDGASLAYVAAPQGRKRAVRSPLAVLPQGGDFLSPVDGVPSQRRLIAARHDRPHRVAPGDGSQ
jgi:hypothetical protein